MVHSALVKLFQMSLHHGNTDLVWTEQEIMLEEEEENKEFN